MVLHFDQHLNAGMSYFGAWMYVILFLIIFCETGLVVTPILPGDSLLFALGALCSREDSVLNVLSGVDTTYDCCSFGGRGKLCHWLPPRS